MLASGKRDGGIEAANASVIGRLTREAAMRHVLRVLALASVLLTHQTVVAVPLTINFDDVADGTVIDTHYPGLTFANPIGGSVFARNGFGFAPSAPNVVALSATGLPIFDASQGAVDVTFSAPQIGVSIDARPVGPVEFLGILLNRPFLEAYSGSTPATFLGRVLYTGTLPTGCCFEVGPTETLTFNSPTANIARVRFSSQQSQSSLHTWGLFDNLRFDAQAALSIAGPPPSPTPGSPNLVPEPGTLLLVGSGLGAIAAGWRRRKSHLR
jgi:hypothetical protein